MIKIFNFQIFAVSLGTPAPAYSPKLSGLSGPNGVSVFSQGSWVSCTFRAQEEKEFEPLVHGFSFCRFTCLVQLLSENIRWEILDKNYELSIPYCFS